jgi:2-C-methyl-D-erythritol 4-phosphate cytidylyltransferase
MRKYAIVTAAGKGMRFGGNKALCPLLGKPLLAWSLDVFAKIVDQMVITFPEGSEEAYRSAAFGFHNVNFVSGGETRYDSVRKAFESLTAGSVVLIHDAARPLVSPDLVERVLSAAAKHGAVVPVLPVMETVKEVTGDRIDRTIPRDRLYVAQTPQGFRFEILADAYSKVVRNDATDESMLVESAGHEVYCVKGEPRNLKITEPSDITLAEFYLKERAT